jgi:Na+/alanine symporter
MNRFTGKINIIDGKLQENLIVEGNSLIHSAPLTPLPFDKGFLRNYKNYIINIKLLLFAFNTTIAYSYYRDRAMTYLFGPSSVVYYKIVYVIGFFIASFTNTTVI